MACHQILRPAISISLSLLVLFGQCLPRYTAALASRCIPPPGFQTSFPLSGCLSHNLLRHSPYRFSGIRQFTREHQYQHFHNLLPECAFCSPMCQLPPTSCWSFFFTITSHGVGSFFLHTTILCCLVTFPMRPVDVSYGYRYIFYSCLNNWCTSYKSKFYYFTKLIDNLTYLTLVRCLLHVGDSAFVANYVAILLYVIKKTLLNNIYRKPIGPISARQQTQYHYRPRKVILDCICLTQTIIITTHTWKNNE